MQPPTASKPVYTEVNLHTDFGSISYFLLKDTNCLLFLIDVLIVV